MPTRGSLLLALCLALTGAGTARAGWIEDQPDRTVIHVKLFDLPDPARADPVSRAGVAAVRKFKDEFPRLFAERYRARYEADPGRYGRHRWDRVEIELERFTGISVKGVEVDLLAIAGGMAPDVLYVNFRKSETYIRNGFLHPLDRLEDGYLAAMPPSEREARIHPRLWPVIRREGPGGVHVWALPYGGAMGNVLMYRKDLFEARRIPQPDADWTMGDLLSAARQLTDPATGTYGFFLVRGKHEAHYWLPFLGSFGGEALVYDEGRQGWRCAFDTPAAVDALDLYVRLSAEKWVDASGRVRRGYSCKDTGDYNARMERGQIGMWFAYVDEQLLATVNPDLVGMAPIPKGPGGSRGTELNSMMMGLFAGIREPAVRDAAWEYMRFLDSREALALKTKVLVESGLGRFIHPRYLREFGYPEIERLSPPGWARTFDIALESATPEPYAGNSNLAYEMMTWPLQRAEALALQDELPEDPSLRHAVLKALLQKGVRRANEQMMGIVPPKERLWRRGVAALVLGGIVVAFVTGFRRVARLFPAGAAPAGTTSRPAWRRYGWAWLLLAPAVLTVLVWQYLPLLRGSTMAFLDYRLIGESAWRGLDNFGDVLFDDAWWLAVVNSFRYSFLTLALTFLPPLFLAILLQEIPRGRLLFRVLFYLPAVVTGIVTILLWKEFLEPSDQGVLNAALMRVPAAGFIGVGLALLAAAGFFARRLWFHGMRLKGALALAAGGVLLWTCWRLAAPILLPAAEPLLLSLARMPGRMTQGLAEPFHWLADPGTAMLSCVLPMIWAGIGPGCLVYLAALKGIPDDYYEAADVDGATFGDKILFVVFPVLKPLLVINFVGAFIGSFYAATGNILVMTGGAANTEVAGLHIWYKAFTFLQFGPATAAAWMLGVILIGFTVQQLKLLARVEFRTQ